MERIESRIVSISVGRENDHIRLREAFGWSLHARQEIRTPFIAEPDEDSDAYFIRSTSHVKLHFVRSPSLPHLEKIKALEAEYYSLSLPVGASYTGPIIMMVMGIAGAVLTFVAPDGGPAGSTALPDRLFSLFLSFAFVIGGAFWLRARDRSVEEAAATRRSTLERRRVILDEVSSLLSEAHH